MKDILTNFKALAQLTLKEHVAYWFAPLSVSGLFLVLFCFGGGWMTELVSPVENREFGILENSAIVVVAVLLVYCIKCFRVSKDIPTKAVFVIASLISLFIFLEEIDYGLHFYELIKHVPSEERLTVRNLHNQDPAVLGEMKIFIYSFVLVAFVLVPLIGEKPFPKFLQQFIGSVKLAYGAAVLLLISSLAVYFVYDLGHIGNNSLEGNTTEFGEGIIYYLILLYMMELYRKQKAQIKSYITK